MPYFVTPYNVLDPNRDQLKSTYNMLASMPEIIRRQLNPIDIADLTKAVICIRVNLGEWIGYKPQLEPIYNFYFNKEENHLFYPPTNMVPAISNQVPAYFCRVTLKIIHDPWDHLLLGGLVHAEIFPEF